MQDMRFQSLLNQGINRDNAAESTPTQRKRYWFQSLLNQGINRDGQILSTCLALRRLPEVSIPS